MRRALTAQDAAIPPIKKLSRVDRGRGGLVVAIERRSGSIDSSICSASPSALSPTTDAATEREHPTCRRRLPRFNRHSRIHQSRVITLDALVAFPADHPPRRALFPLSQYLCRVCPGHHSPTEKESASECSPPVRLFNACGLAGRHHKVPMVPQISQGSGPTHPQLSIRICFAERYPHHDCPRLCPCVVQRYLVVALLPHRSVLHHTQ